MLYVLGEYFCSGMLAAHYPVGQYSYPTSTSGPRRAVTRGAADCLIARARHIREQSSWAMSTSTCTDININININNNANTRLLGYSYINTLSITATTAPLPKQELHSFASSSTPATCLVLSRRYCDPAHVSQASSVNGAVSNPEPPLLLPSFPFPAKACHPPSDLDSVIPSYPPAYLGRLAPGDGRRKQASKHPSQKTRAGQGSRRATVPTSCHVKFSDPYGQALTRPAHCGATSEHHTGPTGTATQKTVHVCESAQSDAPVPIGGAGHAHDSLTRPPSRTQVPLPKGKTSIG